LNPSCVGIGLGEDTALIISNGNTANCIGSGMVVMIDGSKIKHTNINTVDDAKAIYIDNLIVSIWAAGNCYKLNNL
jgi:cyanophycinase